MGCAILVSGEWEEGRELRKGSFGKEGFLGSGSSMGRFEGKKVVEGTYVILGII